MWRGVCILTLFASAAAAQVIEGSVINAANHQPVGGVQVTIYGPDKSVSVTSDAQGSFRSGELPAGEYHALYNKPGFDSPGGDDAALKPFVLTGGSPTRLNVRMYPQSKVSGRVLDLNGEPIARVPVMLTSTRRGVGASTDAYGRYEIDFVPAGSYRLSAHPSGQLKPPPPKGDEHRGWLETYYPNVTDSRSAPKIEILPGSDLQGQDIRLQAAVAHQLRGKVLDERGSVAVHVTVTLDGNRIPGSREEMTPTTVTNDDGEFRFEDLRDGLWRLSAKVEGGAAPLMAFTTERVVGRDIDRVQLRLARTFEIRGSVNVDGSHSASVTLIPDGGGLNVPRATADDDGNFTIAGVHPGRYAIRANYSGADTYLAAVMLGERDVMAEPAVELSSGELPIQVVYKTDGGGLRGKVENCGTATLLLVPQEMASQNPAFWKTVRCGEQGRYQFGNVRPGEYLVVATEQMPGMEELLFGSPVDPQLLNQATRVTIRPKEVAEADLKVARIQ